MQTTMLDIQQLPLVYFNLEPSLNESLPKIIIALIQSYMEYNIFKLDLNKCVDTQHDIPTGLYLLRTIRYILKLAKPI